MRELEETEYREVWDVFYEVFQFHPSVGSFPAILEPSQSITFRLRDQHEDIEVNELQETIFDAFSKIVGSSMEVYYLDWHHDCFGINIGSNPSWITGYPDGDYAILLTKDMQFGTFGHPWEQSICFFGDTFVKAVLKKRPSILEKVIRNKGGYEF